MPDSPMRGPACGSVVFSTGVVTSLDAQAAGPMRNPPMMTRSESPANRRTFGRNAVTNSAATPIVTSTSIVGCAHAVELGRAVHDQSLGRDSQADDRCDQERRRRVAPDRA